MLHGTGYGCGMAQGQEMRSSECTLLVYNSAAAMVGAVAMFALVRSTIVVPSMVEERLAARVVVPLANRFAFMPPGALLPTEPATSELALKPSLSDEADMPGAWSANVQPEMTLQPTAWQFALLTSRHPNRQLANPGILQRASTLKSRLAEISPAATLRLAAKFEAAKAIWPPAEIAFIVLKDEMVLELYARPRGGSWDMIHRYRVLAASGGAGPKLRQGDRQVPEGVYAIAVLNPRSAYHLSLGLNYPNAFDRQMALRDGRKDLGGDIMIHGKNLSTGCLAMGDEAVEELFVLAAQTGLSNVKVIIAPTDFRQAGLPPPQPGQLEWLPKLYREIADAMSEYKKPRSTGPLSFFTK